jgi:hypothetical protein
MVYFLALIPATALTIAGYLVLYVAHRSEGVFRAVGKYLGFWAFTLAGLVVLGAIFAAAHGGRGGAALGMHGIRGRIHGPWPGEPPFAGPRGARPVFGPRPPEGGPNPAGPPQQAPPP